jgi:hypothetical protein
MVTGVSLHPWEPEPPLPPEQTKTMMMPDRSSALPTGGGRLTVIIHVYVFIILGVLK